MGDALMSTIGHALNLILNMVQLLVFVSIFISLLGADPRNPIVSFVERATEPMYRPLRRVTRNIPGPFDWAPFIILVVITSIQRGIVVRMMNGTLGM